MLLALIACLAALHAAAAPVSVSLRLVGPPEAGTPLRVRYEVTDPTQAWQELGKLCVWPASASDSDRPVPDHMVRCYKGPTVLMALPHSWAHADQINAAVVRQDSTSVIADAMLSAVTIIQLPNSTDSAHPTYTHEESHLLAGMRARLSLAQSSVHDVRDPLWVAFHSQLFEILLNESVNPFKVRMWTDLLWMLGEACNNFHCDEHLLVLQGNSRWEQVCGVPFSWSRCEIKLLHLRVIALTT